jgi:hypothetical protein
MKNILFISVFFLLQLNSFTQKYDAELLLQETKIEVKKGNEKIVFKKKMIAEKRCPKSFGVSSMLFGHSFLFV